MATTDLAAADIRSARPAGPDGAGTVVLWPHESDPRVAADRAGRTRLAPPGASAPVAPPPVARLAPAGRLDVVTARALRSAATDAMRSQPRTLVIDLVSVTHLDAAGLASVSNAALAARRAGIGCRVLGPRADAPRRVLEMTGMDRLLLDGPTSRIGR